MGTRRNDVAELREEIRQLREMLTGSRRELLAAQARGQKERVNTRPVELPVNLQRPRTMEELVQRYVQGAMSQWAAEHKMGTFEEEDDFEEVDPDTLPNFPFAIVEYAMTDESPPGSNPDASSGPPEGEGSPEGDPVPSPRRGDSERPQAANSGSEAPTGLESPDPGAVRT